MNVAVLSREFDESAASRAIAEAVGRELDIRTARAFVPLLGSHRHKGAWGGRSSGKSHFFAECAVERCVMYPGSRIVCVREVQKSLKLSVKLLIEDKIKAMGLSKDFHVLNTHIVTPGDGIITFQGMQNHTADSVKSLEAYDVALLEEAQNISERSLGLLRPTIRKDAINGRPASEMWYAWNPKSPKDPVDAFFRKDPPKNAICVEANYDDNPWLPNVSREDMEYDRRRDHERYLHVWKGHYQQHSQARVFRNWRVGDEDEFVTTPKTVFRYGADWGFSIDPTVIVRMYVVGRTLYIDREAYKIGCRIEDIPQHFDTLDDGQARRWRVVADSARPDTIDYVKRHGYAKIIPAKKGTGSVEDGVEFLQSFDIVVHPSCSHTIDELTLFSYKVDKLTEEVLPVLADKDNHVIDSARYALEGVRLGGTYTLDNVR